MRNGHTLQEATVLMRRAVEIASECIESQVSSPMMRTSPQVRHPQIVLSLSCYGATMTPGQEYTGHYDAPYGPASTSTEALPALVQWHYERLQVFALDPKTWSLISWVAFETVPLLSEAIAIRRSMWKLRQDMRCRQEAHWPGWWISFVFPDGKLPEAGVDISQIVPATFSSQDGQEIPTGIGINCTKLRYLPALVEGMTSSLSNLLLKGSKVPWLILYPDGGLTYDTNTRTWQSQSNSPSTATDWAKELYAIASSLLESRGTENCWKFILGGCCKAGPECITELARTAGRRTRAMVREV